jgi:hypothetical protein
MGSLSKMPMQLDVLKIEDIKVENRILEVLLDVQFDGIEHSRGRIWVRLDMENAYCLRSRLISGMVTASNQRLQGV